MKLESKTYKIKTGCGNLFLTIAFEKDKITEILAHFGKNGTCKKTTMEAISRLLSLLFKKDCDIDTIIKELEGMKCDNAIITEGEKVSSCIDAISKILKNLGKEEQ